MNVSQRNRVIDGQCRGILNWQWHCPARRPDLDVVVLVECEAMIDAGRQHDHVTLLAVDADPPVLRVTDIKIA